jgi:hypothetical protein
MVFINGDATILRCYNGQTGSSTGNCGFTATRGGLASSGEYIINFGFQVDDRFWVATPDGGCCNDAISVHVNASSANSLHIFVRNQDVSATDRPVMLIVY